MRVCVCVRTCAPWLPRYAMLVTLAAGVPPSPAAAFDKAAFIASLLLTYGPASEYAVALEARALEYDPTRYPHTPRDCVCALARTCECECACVHVRRSVEKHDPVPGPWQHAAVSHFKKAVEEGAAVTGHPTSQETDGFTSTIPLIAK